jgi:Tol biopolymer transport system component
MTPTLQTRNRAGLLAGALALALVATPLPGQNPPPHADWFAFDTEHFRVIYHAGLEELARHAADVAERTHAVLRQELAPAPRGPIDLVVTDHVDFSNGFATPFTANRVIVFAHPPATSPSLGYGRDWLELVIAHELVHTFHLDHAGTVGRLARSVFGRVPMVWPLFPALSTPTWNIEGLATFYESRLTGAGRAHGSYHDMVIRMAALEAEIPRLRDVSAPSPVWPGGERSYIYGAALMEWIAEQYGVEAHAALARATYGAVVPTFLSFDPVARRVLDRSFTDVYDEWRAAATDSAHALRDRLAAQGLTPAETVVGRGPYAVAPRVAPDGRSLSYAAHDYRSDPATRIVDLRTGRIADLARRNQFGALLGPASWLPDGRGVVVAQLEVRDRYRMPSDLWLVDPDGRETRLTRGARIAGPDVAPDGRRVAAVQARDGAIRLVEHDLASGQTRVVADARPGEAFDAPRWSPDGASIAAARTAGGRTSIVLVDAATGAITEVTGDEALNGTPAWSPDGRWLVFRSDRTGIPNLFAAPIAPDGRPAPGEPLRQLTNVLGGAFDPEVHPDGGEMYFASYHHHGWHLVRAPFDPAGSPPAAPPVLTYQESVLEPPTAPAASAPGPELHHPYRAWPGARPRFWIPYYTVAGDATAGQWSRFLGAYSMGWDVLERHAWAASAAYDMDTGRLAGAATWTWRGMGNPDIAFGASRDWSGVGRLELEDRPDEAVLLREDRAALAATLWHRRWRRAAWLGFGAQVLREEYQAYRLTDQQLADAGFTLRDLPTTFSVSVRPGFSNVRMHPYSISRQDGFTASAAAARRWNLEDRSIAYDELLGALTAFRGHRLWGFADHVVALRTAGRLRSGPGASAFSIGGTHGTAHDLLLIGGQAGTFLPVRGFRSGDRTGTRAWTASAEYRFPLFLAGDPGHLLGLSLASAYGALFADAGNAWCTASQQNTLHGCPDHRPDPLASVGAEIGVNLGLFDGFPLTVRSGLAIPIAGPAHRALTLHVGFGPSF